MLMTTRNTPLPLASGLPAVSARMVSPLSTVNGDNIDTSKHVVVVADRFAPFADGDRVLTMSDLLLHVAVNSPGERGHPLVIHLGQGIDNADRQVLEAACLRNGTPVARMAAREFPRGEQVTPDIVHKRHPENVLLANVRHHNGEYCAADLRIHRDNELVMDHRTGEHVQGMVIIEAIRQICIAQFETGHRRELPGIEYAGVWKSINLRFQDFLFALPATVASEVTFADLSKPINLKFQVRASICQNGVEVASAEIDYSMIKQDRFTSLERAKSKRARQAYLARFAG